VRGGSVNVGAFRCAIYIIYVYICIHVIHRIGFTLDLI